MKSDKANCRKKNENFFRLQNQLDIHIQSLSYIHFLCKLGVVLLCARLASATKIKNGLWQFTAQREST